MQIEANVIKKEGSVSVVVYTKDEGRHVKSMVSAILRTGRKEYILLPEAPEQNNVAYASRRKNCVIALEEGLFEAKYEGPDAGEIKTIEILAVQDGKTERILIDV